MASLTEVLGVFCWCLPCFSAAHVDGQDRDPLLPRNDENDDETSLQRQLHQKLHSYQMLRALSQGFMPSNEQVIIHLRTILASDLLNPDNQDVSDSGRALVHYFKLFIKQMIDLLYHKNGLDQIQDFIWYSSQARLSIDTKDIANRTAKARSKAQTAAVYKSLQTIGSLLLSNSEFRLFLSDLTAAGKEVFRDTALSLSEVSKQTAHRLGPSQEEQAELKKKGSDEECAPGTEELQQSVTEVLKEVRTGAVQVSQAAERSVVDKVAATAASAEEKSIMVERLKRAVMSLRKRPDYTESASTLALILQRYAFAYSHALSDAVATADQDFKTNTEGEKAIENFWSFLKSFGDADEWQELQERFKQVVEYGRHDPKFDQVIRQIGNAVQDALTDPAFFEEAAEKRFHDLQTQSRQLAQGSSLREALDGLLVKLQTTWHAMLEDTDVASLLQTARHIAQILSPPEQYTNSELLEDAINVFGPMMIQSIQYVPIPRLEISTSKIDVLLENVILEPGVSVNNTSFLPFRLRVESRNDLEIRKGRSRTASSVQSMTTIKIEGMSVRAKEIGFWLRLRSALLHVEDEGIASFDLDERGMDVEIAMEVAKERLESMVSLRDVRVRIHKLDYQIRKSRFSLASSIFKPAIIPMLRSAIESQLCTGIADLIHAANREIVFARERLRATRIADPDDLWTFIQAVSARLVPEQDPDLYTRIGINEAGKGVFKELYAPGSIVKTWNEEALQARQKIRQGEGDGWRNSIYDVMTN